jgi:UDP-N-acetylglucosamine transferase subunit ALG13
MHLACSSGGHIDLLMRLAPALAEYEQVWVTQPSQRADELLRTGARMILLPEYSRNPARGKTAKTIIQSATAAVNGRPRLVLTAGSGLVVPFCAFSRAVGARMVFIETAARVRTPSKSGRVLSRLANRTIVQWKPMLDVYAGAALALPSVLEHVKAHPDMPGEGTFVGVGTHIYPFDRLLRIVDDAVERGILPGPVVAQTGVSTYRPRAFEARAWLAPTEIHSAVKSSRHVITHAGAGLMSAALSAGRRPLVLPRRAELREHFDEHQQQLVGELGRLDMIVLLGTGITNSDLEASTRPLPDPRLTLHATPLGDVVAAELSRLRR